MKVAPVTVSYIPLRKIEPEEPEEPDADEEEDDEDEDSEWDEDDDWDDEDEGPGREICAVRFPQDDGWSRKRYCYHTDSILDPGDWVIVNVRGENIPVLVVATPYGSLDMEDGCIKNSEYDKATRSIERLARKLEINRVKRKYPRALIR